MKNSCFNCEYFRLYRGTCDSLGVPQEPDDYECGGEPTEEDYDTYFTDGKEWSDTENGCSAFVMREFEDDY